MADDDYWAGLSRASGNERAFDDLAWRLLEQATRDCAAGTVSTDDAAWAMTRALHAFAEVPMPTGAALVAMVAGWAATITEWADERRRVVVPFRRM